MVKSILDSCLDSNRDKLPSGVLPKHISQVKMNSYTNNSRDSVSMNLYFKGVASIPNQKYYSIDGLTVKQFMSLYNVIFDEVEVDVNFLFNEFNGIEE